MTMTNPGCGGGALTNWTATARSRAPSLLKSAATIETGELKGGITCANAGGADCVSQTTATTSNRRMATALHPRPVHAATAADLSMIVRFMSPLPQMAARLYQRGLKQNTTNARIENE